MTGAAVFAGRRWIFKFIFWQGFPWSALELSGALAAHTKVAIIGQTMGPFRPAGKQVAEILREIQPIYVRGRTSRTVLRELGVYHARRCADSAFLSELNVAKKNGNGQRPRSCLYIAS
jgi:polysaccharide pyruvyl transferase WcaK-like protein